MDTLKDIFFFVGSVLGIIAFSKTLLDPIMEANRRKWEQVKMRVTELTFRDIEYSVEMARRIDDEMLLQIHFFIRDIEEGAEYLRFGPVLRKHYQRHLKNLCNLYRAFRKYVQVPYWDIIYNSRNGSERKDWVFQKEYFEKERPDIDEYVEHLNAASELAEKMRTEFQALSILSGLHIVELPFATRIVQTARRNQRRTSKVE